MVPIVLTDTSPPRAALAFRPDNFYVESVPGDTVDVFLAYVTARGLQPSAVIAPPAEPTPGWSLRVDAGSGTVTVTDSIDLVFTTPGLVFPTEWMDALTASGDCVIALVSRGELDRTGLEVAARQGRLAVGLARVMADDA